jgi:Leucine-rich repeat (LRR) protein
MNYDCLAIIFSKLSLSELSTVNQVCKQWNDVANDTDIWKQLYGTDLLRKCGTYENIKWKELYQYMHLRKDIMRSFVNSLHRNKKCGYHDIPKEIERLPLEFYTITNTISLEAPRLLELSSRIAHLQNLTNLDITNSKITVLPEELFHVTSLISLHIENVKITKLPKSIIKLINLETLNMDGCDLTELPILPPNLQYLRI